MRALPPHRATATVAGLFILGVLLGSWAGRAAVARATDPYAGLERFARMLTAIESDYVEPVDTERLVDAAIHGMVEELDPHSRWMDAREVTELRSDAEGEETGFGVELTLHDRGVRILKVLPGSPAELEGLQVGDLILAIDGEPLLGLTLTEVEARMAGERGERSSLTVLREGWDEPQVLDTQRDQVKVPALEAHRFEDILYVRFIDFQRGSAADLRDAIVAEQGLAGLILDLRDNTGGLLDEAVGVADLFLADGTIVSVRGRRDGRETYEATRKAPAAGLQVAILINRYSASASEIVAGALREAKRATLIGTQTYGKGSVQQLYRNPDGSALKLTVARYHLPSGRTIPPREGLEPDIEVVWDDQRPPSRLLRERLATLALNEEEQADLFALLDQLEDPRPKRRAIPWSATPEQRAKGDPVLRRALEHLR